MIERYVAAGFIVLAAILLLVYGILAHRKNASPLRQLPQLQALELAHNLNLEQGNKLVYLAGGHLFGEQVTLNSLVSLPLLRKLTTQSVLSDRPPIVLSADGQMAILSRMILAGVYEDALVPNLLYKDYSHTTGGSRFSYLAGCLPELFWDHIGMLVMAGHFQPEMVLLADLSARKDYFTFAGSDSIAAQAALFTTTGHVLVGEEFFSLPLYGKNPHKTHASLKTQDFLRVLIIFVVIVASLLKSLGVF